MQPYQKHQKIDWFLFFFFMVFLFLFLFFFNFLFGTVIINLNRKLLTKYINEQNLGVLNGGTRVKIQPSLP